MKFKLRNINLEISFSFLALVLLFISVGKSTILTITLCSAFIHEITHIILIYAFGGKIKSIKLSILGGNISREINKTSFLEEGIINLSAPIVNLFIFFFFSLYSTNISKIISSVNLFLGLFNLLPFESFDGGKGLMCLLKIFFNSAKIEKIFFLISLFTTIGFIVVFFVSCFNGYFNPFLILTIIFMIISLVLKK